MIQEQISCTKCKAKNPPHRIWCNSCGDPLPFHLTYTSATPNQQLAKRKAIYSAVLDDLRESSEEQLDYAHDLDIVEKFCKEQLNFIDHQEVRIKNQQRAFELAKSAFNAAQKKHFTEAIDLLQQAIGNPDHDPIFFDYLEEVREKFRQNDLWTQAENLLNEATELIATHQLQEAVHKLERAERLAPNHPKITLVLADTRKQIAAATASPSSLQSNESVQDIPYATIVDTPTIATQVPVSPKRPFTELVPTEVSTTPISQTSFAEAEEELPGPVQRLIESASYWPSLLKPFLLDNVGWFVGVFLVIAGFVVLIVSFWGSIANNPLLMHSLVYVSLAISAGLFFSAAYFMRLRYPQLESSSNVLLVVVALLIPLVFASAALTSMIPASKTAESTLQSSQQISG